MSIESTIKDTTDWVSGKRKILLSSHPDAARYKQLEKSSENVPHISEFE